MDTMDHDTLQKNYLSTRFQKLWTNKPEDKFYLPKL